MISIYFPPFCSKEYEYGGNITVILCEGVKATLIKLFFDGQTPILFKPLLLLDLCDSNWTCIKANTVVSTYIWVLPECKHNTYAFILISVLSNTTSANEIATHYHIKLCSSLYKYLSVLLSFPSTLKQLVIGLNLLYVLFYLISSRLHYKDIISSHFIS